MNCLKNLEKEVKKLKDLASSNNANQINGEKQLLDLEDVMDFISNTFDDFERDRLAIVAIDRQGQYSRRNFLLSHGIPGNKNENADVLAMKVIDTKMEIKITQNDIDRTLRIRKSKTNGKPRPVIIKFVRYNDRKKFFSSKKFLKDSGVSITEGLLAFRMKQLTKGKRDFRV